MNFCTQCGNSIDPAARVCPVCGNRLRPSMQSAGQVRKNQREQQENPASEQAKGAPAAENERRAAAAPAPKKPKKKSSGNKAHVALLIAIIAVAAALAIVVGAFFLKIQKDVSGDTKKTEETSEASDSKKLTKTPKPEKTESAEEKSTADASETKEATKTPEPTKTEKPTATPTETPTAEPTESPIPTATATPTAEPTESPIPTPSTTPTPEPTESPIPTPPPSITPTPPPSITTVAPTPEPSNDGHAFGPGAAPSSYTTYYAAVDNGYLALRNAKVFDTNNEIGKVMNGQEFYVTETDGDYWYGYAPSLGMWGYVNGSYLTQKTGGSETYTNQGNYTAKVDSGYLALRSAAATDSSNEIGKINTGDKVEVIDKGSGEFWWVYVPSLGQYGFVNSKYLVES